MLTADPPKITDPYAVKLDQLCLGLPEQEKEAVIMGLLENDIEFFGRKAMAHHLYKAPAEFHSEVYLLLPQCRYLAIAAPRGSAKSTIIMGVYALNCISFFKKRFVVMISNTFSKAAMFLETLKTEVMTNSLIRDDLHVARNKKCWSEGDAEFVTPGGITKVVCKGSKEIPDIRGVKFGASRPDLFLIDDLENDEQMRSFDRRHELQKLFKEVIMKAGDVDTCQYVVIGTILHFDSLLNNLITGKLQMDVPWETRLYKGLIEEAA